MLSPPPFGFTQVKTNTERDTRTPPFRLESSSTVTRTYSPKATDVQHDWLVIDATDVVLGRLASQVAALLRGKHKPTFAPHMDMGDYVVVVNADKVVLTHNKPQQKR